MGPADYTAITLFALSLGALLAFSPRARGVLLALRHPLRTTYLDEAGNDVTGQVEPAAAPATPDPDDTTFTKGARQRGQESRR